MRPAEQQLQWAVQALAQPADVQPSLFPPFVAVADELAIEFDACHQYAGPCIGGLWTPEQRVALAALNRLLTEMSGPDEPELWEGTECLNHPTWTEVRRLANEVLLVFDWLSVRPPMGHAVYVPGSQGR